MKKTLLLLVLLAVISLTYGNEPQIKVVKGQNLSSQNLTSQKMSKDTCVQSDSSDSSQG